MAWITDLDPYLLPYDSALRQRAARYEAKKRALLGDCPSLSDFANGHHFFGLHDEDGGTYYREWAPAAERAFLIGDFNGWDRAACPMEKNARGEFSVFVPQGIPEGSYFKILLERQGKSFERIPAYARAVVQNENGAWCAKRVSQRPYPWKNDGVRRKKDLIIYECHVGMAQEEGRVGRYREFTEKILPRIVADGYTAIQIMAIMEHPYYGSFGYQVSSFYAVSSRFGTPEELKDLIDAAHGKGLRVLLDVVHSHAVKNTDEGLSCFDGTETQYFHGGQRGLHPAWDTRLFDYGKNEVLHFLLSNLKFYLTEYHFDGFRFDGVTSMLYRDHGLGVAFTHYDHYFGDNTDEDALLYLQLACELVHELNPEAITIAEDMSGMPGACLPVRDGGIGFDYRLSMGVPDLWTRLTTKVPDEQWRVGEIWHELTQGRPQEKKIAYAESHDQALVGDKTLMFRLCDREMYTHMRKDADSLIIDRGMALHKLIRLLTLTLGGEGYLNFMGNEFGHPEWIDFPREGNGWSYHYCRRQWHLADDPELRYGQLGAFDREMLALVKRRAQCNRKPRLLALHEENQTLFFQKGDLIYAFNLHPTQSLPNCRIPVKRGRYRVALNTDEKRFGGFGRISTSQDYTADDGNVGIYLPSRTALCLVPVRE